MRFASVDVTIPPDHEPGKIERPRRLPPKPSAEFTIVDPQRFRSADQFSSAVNTRLANLPNGHRDILLFVHGYNTTTTDAVLRVAQFVEDSDYLGVPVILDWASAGKATRYLYDMNSALIARQSIPRVIEVLGATMVEKVDLFAHSMGSLLTMEGLIHHQLRFPDIEQRKLSSIVLASPDIDLDLFRSQLQLLHKEFTIFVLMSEDDQALRFSRYIAGGIPRVGASASDDLTELGAVVIDLSEIQVEGSSNHSKFSDSPEVVKVIGRMLNKTGNIENRSRFSLLEELMLTVPVKILTESE
jgi:esterase/lipase superfamily enzyme